MKKSIFIFCVILLNFIFLNATYSSQFEPDIDKAIPLTSSSPQYQEYIDPLYRYALNLEPEELAEEIAQLKDNITNYETTLRTSTRHVRNTRAVFKWNAYAFESFEGIGTVISAINWDCAVTFVVNVVNAGLKAVKLGSYFISQKAHAEKEKRVESSEDRLREWKIKLDSFCAAQRLLGHKPPRVFQMSQVLDTTPIGWSYERIKLPQTVAKAVLAYANRDVDMIPIEEVHEVVDEEGRGLHIVVSDSEAKDMDNARLLQALDRIDLLVQEFDDIAMERFGRREAQYYLTWAYYHKRIEKTLRAIGHVGEGIEMMLVIVNTLDIGCENKAKVSIAIAVVKALKVFCYFVAGKSEGAAKRRKKKALQMREQLVQWRHVLQEEARKRNIRPVPQYAEQSTLVVHPRDEVRDINDSVFVSVSLSGSDNTIE